MQNSASDCREFIERLSRWFVGTTPALKEINMKNMNKLLSALCATVLSLPLVSSAEVPKSKFLSDEPSCCKTQSSSARGPIDHFKTESDRATTQAIRKAIYSDSALDQAYNQVTISTVDGEVTLNGTVASQSDKDGVWSKARQNANRRQIHNSILVDSAACGVCYQQSSNSSTRQHGPMDRYITKSDRVTTESIRSAIYNDSSLDQAYNQVTISTLNGEVTLRGTVGSQSDRDGVWNKARQSVSSKRIHNEIVVDRSLASNDYPSNVSPRKHGPVDHYLTQSDRSITESIRNAIYNDSSLDRVYDRVTISTLKGNVTLNGQVFSDSEKKSIWNKARETVSSRNIDNQLVVINS